MNVKRIFKSFFMGLVFLYCSNKKMCKVRELYNGSIQERFSFPFNLIKLYPNFLDRVDQLLTPQRRMTNHLIKDQIPTSTSLDEDKLMFEAI